MGPDPDNTERPANEAELEIASRRIEMADGRYMIFFTFERRPEQTSEGNETDV